MTNLVLGAAFGYNVDKVKPFVLSLRRYYSDMIVFVVDQLDPATEEFYAEHNIYTFVPDAPVNRGYGNVDRFRFYLDCLEQLEDIDRILLTDIRDVVFQSDPFANDIAHDIEFFAEPELFKNCSHNGPWYAGLYGQDELAKIGDEWVLCAGTTLGRRDTIEKYVSDLITEIEKLEQSGRAHGTCDQAVHNYLVYNGFFDNYGINQNGQGLVSTMHHSKTLTFDRQGRMLNEDGSPTPIVHQYDRCGPMSLIFLKNALGSTGRAGIQACANYAITNFFEHDLG